jgi:hypothetical protein
VASSTYATVTPLAVVSGPLVSLPTIGQRLHELQQEQVCFRLFLNPRLRAQSSCNLAPQHCACCFAFPLAWNGPDHWSSASTYALRQFNRPWPHMHLLQWPARPLLLTRLRMILVSLPRPGWTMASASTSSPRPPRRPLAPPLHTVTRCSLWGALRSSRMYVAAMDV